MSSGIQSGVVEEKRTPFLKDPSPSAEAAAMGAPSTTRPPLVTEKSLRYRPFKAEKRATQRRTLGSEPRTIQIAKARASFALPFPRAEKSGPPIKGRAPAIVSGL